MPLVLRLHPGDKCIRRSCGADFRAYDVGTGEDDHLAGMYIEAEPVTAYMRAALQDSHLGIMLCISGNHLVTPGGGERHRPACQVRFVGLRLVKRSQNEKDCTLRQRELCRRVVKS
jgi:hypothetical protein